MFNNNFAEILYRRKKKVKRKKGFGQRLTLKLLIDLQIPKSQ